ncbi:methyl-accepting chemotaxis protein [Primorskyibacter sp. 2E107]|uniref:methyl-accepting chemotaxis protein n=1 Tax=Primorskyibacter sp. 2E107 TaxID=3403458 RepID=UPI003AF68053
MLYPIRNLPIVVKGVIGSLLAISGLVYIIYMAFAELDDSANRMHEVSSKMLPELNYGAQMVSATSQMHLELLQLITYANSSVGADVMQRHIDQTVAAGQAFRDLLGAMTGPEKETLEQLAAEYFMQVEQAITFVTVDASMAAMFLSGTRESYQQIDGIISGIMEQASATTGNRVDDMATEATAVIETFSPLAIAAIGGGLFITILIQLSIARPVRRMTAAMTAVTEARFDVKVPCQGLTNELGRMAAALSVFRDAAQEREARAVAFERLQQTLGKSLQSAHRGEFDVRIEENFEFAELQEIARAVNRLVAGLEHAFTEVGAVLHALANADLTRRMEGQFEGAFEILQNDVATTCDTLSSLVGTIRDTSSQAKSASREIADGSQTLSGQSDRQAASLEEASAALQGMSDLMKNSAKNADDAAGFSREAKQSAHRGRKVAESAVEAMSNVKSSSNKIAEIASAIDSIAFNTNLLALNAAVEAARAGAAGKGFSIVAGEVRSLAQMTSDAAANITTLVSESGPLIELGVTNVGETNSELNMIAGHVERLASLIEELSQSVKEQATNSDEITAAVRDMESITINNAAMADTSSQAATRLAVLVDTLDDLVGRFNAKSSDRPQQALAS